MFRKTFLFTTLTICLTICSLISTTNAETNSMDGEQSTTTVVLETNQGNIELQLYTDEAPKTCENMVGLVRKGYYDGIIFHRVIKDFMIQGGDPTGTGRGGESFWGGKFEDEFNPELKFNQAGILAMANAGPNTNGSQFFITTKETPWLNMRHTIFGVVVAGYDVVEKIENTKVGPGDKPVKDQVITRAYIKEDLSKKEPSSEDEELSESADASSEEEPLNSES